MHKLCCFVVQAARTSSILNFVEVILLFMEEHPTERTAQFLLNFTAFTTLTTTTLTTITPIVYSRRHTRHIRFHFSFNLIVTDTTHSTRFARNRNPIRLITWCFQRQLQISYDTACTDTSARNRNPLRLIISHTITECHNYRTINVCTKFSMPNSGGHFTPTVFTHQHCQYMKQQYHLRYRSSIKFLALTLHLGSQGQNSLRQLLWGYPPRIHFEKITFTYANSIGNIKQQ